MRINYTGRGFRVVTFKDRYEQPCSIQESSSVTPSLWFGIDSDRMHLSQQMVRDLLPLLEYFAEHGVLPNRKRDRRVKVAANEEEDK